MHLPSTLRRAARVALAVAISGASAVVVGAVAAPSAAQAASVVNGPIARAETMSRAQYWVDRGVTYTQTGPWAGDGTGRTYRRDCSGLVSMAWHLSTSYVTGHFQDVDGTYPWHRLPSRAHLKTGDAIVRTGHMELFSHWKNNADHGQGAYVYSFNQTGETVRNPYVRNNVGNLGFNSGSEMDTYTPIRYNRIVDGGGGAPVIRTLTGASGDFNRDGNFDIVSRAPDGSLWLYSGTGAATADRVVNPAIRIGLGWESSNALITGDFNRDGVHDIVSRTADGSLWLYTGTGAATADRVVNPPIRIGLGWDGSTALTTGDFNRDGVHDIVSRTADGSLWLYTGTGAATADRIVNPATRIGVGWESSTALVTGDFNRDGNFDIGSRVADGSMWLYTGTGAATADRVVNPGIRIGVGWDGSTALTAGDFNRDGVHDIVSRVADGSMWVYTGTGAATADRVVNPGIRVGTGWETSSALT